MNVTRENIDELNGIIRVSIEKADYEANVEQALTDYRKKASMPGFRPGKVPHGLVKKMYGKSAMVDEVNKLLSNGLSKFIVDEKLDLLGEPLPNEDQQKPIDWEKDTDYEFVFDIAFAPEVKISFDKKTKFPFYKIKVTEETIDAKVESYAKRLGSTKDAEIIEKESTSRGDFAKVDENGAIIEGELSSEMTLISIGLIKDEEILNSFIGKKIGDEVIFDIRKAYPNNTELAYILNISKEEAENVEGNFKFIIKEISNFVAAEINEELFVKIYGEESGIKTEKEFREKVAEEISLSYLPSGQYKFAIDAREIIVNKLKFELPVPFLKRWLLAINKELTQEQIDADFDNFEEDLRWQIIKEKIIEENELKVEEAEVVEFAKQVALQQFRQYGMLDIPEEHLEGFARQILEKKDDKQRIVTKVMEDKIMTVVREKVTVEEKEVTTEEFEKMFDKK
jgi:trigger factor